MLLGGIEGERDRDRAREQGIERDAKCMSKGATRNVGINRKNSTFVTDRALFGIKPVGRDAEHVIALDADAVDDRTYDGAGLGGFDQAARRRSDSFLGRALSRHGRILARRGRPSIGARDGVPGGTRNASLLQG
jgi:hypothetical protein